MKAADPKGDAINYWTLKTPEYSDYFLEAASI